MTKHHSGLAVPRLTSAATQPLQADDAEAYCCLAGAHRFVITAFVTGSRILGRSFVAAYQQAQAASKYQRHVAKNGGGGASASASLSGGMTLDEACKVLNVKPPAGGQANVAEVLERYQRLFDANDPQKGGSFYLQSKIVRAKERFERELGPMREKVEHEAEAKEGWKPKVYKDR
ncbi:mitochondrial import inner membrane translocase subunit tim-16 [Cordyceps militaris]|uniref:Mitochondrial import inner membrane translocase subunit TIM16 n=1 Tax=Cordyceps militaris TaxID=73501 RepID=A0A2H4S769_CORMI|nr:mitochondrial import inner membrane translocase subunit tim-16 [Cordyceps militaris]